MSMIKINIDVLKLDKTAFYKGKKGTYAELLLIENKNGTDDYGNDGFVKQDLGVERKDEDRPIIGNWKVLRKKREEPAARPAQRQAAPPTDDIDDIFN